MNFDFVHKDSICDTCGKLLLVENKYYNFVKVKKNNENDIQRFDCIECNRKKIGAKELNCYKCKKLVKIENFDMYKYHGAYFHKTYCNKHDCDNCGKPLEIEYKYHEDVYVGARTDHIVRALFCRNCFCDFNHMDSKWCYKCRCLVKLDNFDSYKDHGYTDYKRYCKKHKNKHSL